jgi:hypothetical protein
MKERHITPNLKPDERFVLQLKVGQSYIKSTDTELKTEQTTTDPVEAKTYSGNYLNTTVWEWSLHCVAIPLKKLPKAPLHAQKRSQTHSESKDESKSQKTSKTR